MGHLSRVRIYQSQKIRKHFIEEMIAALGIKDKQHLNMGRREQNILNFMSNDPQGGMMEKAFEDCDDHYCCSPISGFPLLVQHGGSAFLMQIWPWSTEWSRAKANRSLPRICTGHSKHPLPTTQEKTLHMDITRWPKGIRLIIFFAVKDGEALTVSRNKTGT